MNKCIKCIFRKALLPVVPAITLMFAFGSCSNNDEKAKPEHDPNKEVVLTTFYPNEGYIRDRVLLDGENFGSDPSMIKVFFNSAEAKVISSIGTRILALVPRMPGDECELTVQIGEQTKKYEQTFQYKIVASVTTLAGNGQVEGVFDQGLDKSVLNPVYIGADLEGNIFVTHVPNTLLRINERENLIQVIADPASGFNQRSLPYANPRTNVLQFGTEANRDGFVFCDPKDGWALKMRFIRNWDLNGYSLPSGTSGNQEAPETHYPCMLCEIDNMFYSRYRDGTIIRIDPETWQAKIVGKTPAGTAYGNAFNPFNQSELWFGYIEVGTGSYANTICRVNVLDETVNESTGFLASFETLNSSSFSNHRDGPLAQAQFDGIRQINFDSQGNLYIGDSNNHCIRMLNTGTMMVETIIGKPRVSGYVDGNKDDALFTFPHGIVVNSEDVIYVSDYGNKRIRRIAIE